MGKYIMSLDAGTSSSRSIVFDKEGNTISVDQKEFKQIYPQPGWVEHDPIEIWETQKSTIIGALEKGKIKGEEIAGIGITNQRETTVIWEKATGKPVYNAIVWQCRRTADYCSCIADKKELIKEKTGLILDPYFSGTKIRWILENVQGAREKAERGELLFGTIETWLIWNLTGGKVHITDESNASRTMLYNINLHKWDEELLDLLTVPMAMLPDVKGNSEVYGYTDKTVMGFTVPVCGAAGDQQAALFGQKCFNTGDAKNTYGTGCFLLMNTGDKPGKSENGLVSTVAWNMDGRTTYALEGSVFVGGASIQWLRDELKIIKNAGESYDIAMSVDDTNGCYVVPAFTGLGAPYWDPYARGTITGITRGVNYKHIVRATLDSIAYQVNDILQAMKSDSGVELGALHVDGGASLNDYLMQTQANLSNIEVVRPECVETTALGAAYLAGLAVGYWKDKSDISINGSISKTFVPDISEEKRNEMLNGWKNAVSKTTYNNKVVEK